MRKILGLIALFLGIGFVITKMADLQAVVDTLKRGDWRFVLLALGVEIGWMVVNAVNYRAIYHAMNLEEKLPRMMLLSTAAEFVNIVAPSGGMGGLTVFVAEARQRGYSSARASVGGVLFILFDYAGFICILIFGLAVLARRNNLNLTEIVASVILFLIAAGMAALMYLGMRSADELGRVLGWIACQVNRILYPFIHRDYLSEARARGFAHDASSGLHMLQRHPRRLILPVVLSIASKTLLILVLLILFLAFHVPFSVGTLIAGFTIAYLFLIVSPTPYGVGIVEGILTLALASLMVPLSAAAVLSLAYRGVTFWLPLFIGMLTFRFLHQVEKISPGS